MPALQVRLQASATIPLDATFDCQPGEMVALLGPSGSGKTSVLRAVAGLLHSRGMAGSVRVGEDVWFDSARAVNWSPQARRAGLVFQSYALFPHLTAMENVAVGAYVMGAGAKNDASLRGLFGRLGLAGLEHRLPAQLSGGQQQRVALARALMRIQVPPDATRAQASSPGTGHGVLLLDEPFSAVDAPTRQTLYRELAALRQHVDTPMVLVTHDLLEARRLADRVVILDGGTTLQSGAPSKVFAQPRNARVAQLVGIQNLFKGRFHQAAPGWGSLQWLSDAPASAAQSLMLHTIDKGRIDDGAEVSWVLAGEALQVLPWPVAPQSLVPADEMARANVLECEVREILELGETCLCTLQPRRLLGETLTLTLSTAQLRAMGGVAGGRLAVRIAPQAIHIMPLRSG